MPTPEQTKNGYFNLWNSARVLEKDKPELKQIAGKILANRQIYKDTEAKTGVPWYMIGPIHYRESSLSFKGHLHNGDPLTRRTVHVPAGRPTGTPPFTWSDSACDALTMPPHDLKKVKNWTLERVLYETERYNGWGYLGKTNSPYLWSGTSEYKGGKYVADHVYSPTAFDKQKGCVAILKTMIELDPSIEIRVAGREITPPDDIEVEDKPTHSKTRIGRRIRDGAGAGTVAGGGAAAGTSGTEAVSQGFTIFTLVMFAVVIGAVVYIVMKRRKARAAANAAWTGVNDVSEQPTVVNPPVSGSSSDLLVRDQTPPKDQTSGSVQGH